MQKKTLINHENQSAAVVKQTKMVHFERVQTHTENAETSSGQLDSDTSLAH